jgi:osmotically-inducible protein OsmY
MYPPASEAAEIDCANVKCRIEAALERHAEVEAKAIRVTVRDGNTVVLEGKFDDMDERRAPDCSRA